MSEYIIRCSGASYQIWRGNELKSCCDSYSEAQDELRELEQEKSIQDEIDALMADFDESLLPF